MIPRICANCAAGSNVTGPQGVLGTVCRATPWTLWKAPDDACLQFAMDDNPAYVLQDDGETVSREQTEEPEEEPEEVEHEA